MPEGKYIEFGVVIGSKKLPEYKIKNQVFTEVDLHGPTSFLINEDGQNYPVVPFSISIHRLSRKPLWVNVYLDGQLLTTRPFCGRQWTLQEQIEQKTSMKMLQTGSCGLHTLHNAFRAGCTASGWEIEDCLSSLFTLFNDTPARREDFLALTGCQSFPLKFCKHRTCDAVKVGSELHELLFSLPMMEENQNRISCLGQHAGTISVVCTVAIERGEKRLPVFQKEKARLCWGRGQRLQHLTKKDIGHYQKSSLVSREGRLTSYLTCTNQHRYAKGYAPSDEILEELVLTYRPRIYSNVPTSSVTIDCSDFPKVEAHGEPGVTKTTCTDLNMEKGAPVGDISQHFAKDNCDLPKTNQAIGELQKGPESFEQQISPENVKRRESSAMVIQKIEEHNSDVGLISPENIKRRASEMFQAIRIKQENHDNSIIIEGDGDEEDILYNEFEGDSLIYMGDDDCYILDLSNNFSIVELEESVLDESE